MLVIVCKLYYFLNFLFYSISIAPLQVTLYSEALPTTAQTLCWSFHAEAHQAIIVSAELAQGPYTWRQGRGVRTHDAPAAAKRPYPRLTHIICLRRSRFSRCKKLSLRFENTLISAQVT